MDNPKFNSGENIFHETPLHEEVIYRIEGVPQYKSEGSPPGWYYDLSKPDLKQIHESKLSPAPRILLYSGDQDAELPSKH